MSTEKNTIDNAINLQIDVSELTCPICTDVFVFPRTYECGHTVCETCMYEMDKHDKTSETHTASIHKCPVCRHPTLKSWRDRPLSVLLERLSSNHPDYIKRKKEVDDIKKKRDVKQESISCNIDIASVSYISRNKIANEIYDTILELIFIAAKQGKNHIIIKNKKIVSDIEKVGDILSRRLFSRNNIFRLIVTMNECTIYFTEDAFSWRRNFENTSWREPMDGSVSLQPTEPPPPVPSSAISIFFN